MTEKLSCTVTKGEMELTTFDSSEDLKAARDQVVNLERGGQHSEQVNSVFFSQKSAKGDTVLYWDDDATLQSAKVIADRRAPIADLESFFTSVDSTTRLPRPGEDPALRHLILENFHNLDTCDRGATVNTGETELTECYSGNLLIWYAKFRDHDAFRVVRKAYYDYGKSEGTAYDWEYGDRTPKVIEDPAGVKARYVDRSGRATLYWDHKRCLCYGTIRGTDERLQPLDTWWDRVN